VLEVVWAWVLRFPFSPSLPLSPPPPELYVLNNTSNINLIEMDDVTEILFFVAVSAIAIKQKKCACN